MTYAFFHLISISRAFRNFSNAQILPLLFYTILRLSYKLYSKRKFLSRAHNSIPRAYTYIYAREFDYRKTYI